MAKEEQAEQAGKSKKKLFIIIGAVVLVLVLGGGGYMMLAGGSSTEEVVEPEPEPGIVLPLDSITINLADGHYLKLKLALQGTIELPEEEADGSKALDLAIAQLSNKPMAELASERGREKAKEELLSEVEEAYEGMVMDIYFTEFVMQ